MALQNLRVELLPLIAGVGLAGAGIALAMQGVLAIAIKPWVKVPDYGPALAQINKAVRETFRARDIVIPFPRRDVRMMRA